MVSFKLITGAISSLIVNWYIGISALASGVYAFTLNVKVLTGSDTISVPSRTILSPPTKNWVSCSIILEVRASPAGSSNWIPSLNVPSCSWSNLITFSKAVVKSFVSASQALTVPVWVVKVFETPNAPDTF